MTDYLEIHSVQTSNQFYLVEDVKKYQQVLLKYYRVSHLLS